MAAILTDLMRRLGKAEARCADGDAQLVMRPNFVIDVGDRGCLVNVDGAEVTNKHASSLQPCLTLTGVARDD